MKNVLIKALLGITILLTGCQSAPVSLNSSTYLQTANSQLRSLATSSNYQIVRTLKNTKFWNRMELIRSQENINPEKIHERGRQRDPNIIKCFGTDLPSSRDFCLHDAGQPASLKNEVPVLLIHGANTVATRAWADPDGDGKRTGLAQYLKKNGFRVFAVTFANKHGDNFIWSKHIGTAINRIQQLTGSKKVSTIGHSKGGFALRLHVSNLYQDKNPFQKNIDKAIFVGTPHRGIDYSFRHPIINWALFPETDDPVRYAPMSWSSLLWQGFWQKADEFDIMGDYFPGQLQMLAKFDKIHSLPKLEQDWYTTYYGGQGFVSKSHGIEKAISKGGNLVARVRRSPVDPSVKVANLVGNSPDVPGILNESTGPSDGILFVESAKATSDLTNGGAKLLSEQVMKLNHLELVSQAAAMNWIKQQLQK